MLTAGFWCCVADVINSIIENAIVEADSVPASTGLKIITKE